MSQPPINAAKLLEMAQQAGKSADATAKETREMFAALKLIPGAAGLMRAELAKLGMSLEQFERMLAGSPNAADVAALLAGKVPPNN